MLLKSKNKVIFKICNLFLTKSIDYN